MRTAPRRRFDAVSSVTNFDGWEEVEQPDRSGVEEAAVDVPLTPEQSRALCALGELAQAVVTMIVVRRLTPDQVAVQLGRSVKDIKLVARNAAKLLGQLTQQECTR